MSTPYQPAGQRVAIPYGGDAAVARSIAQVHRRNPWTGRCRACKDRYPCRDRQDACAVLGEVEPASRLPVLAGVVGTALPVILGLLLIAGSVSGLAR
ncbi:MAG: hypothetical protein GEU94_10095 [Micromonosporaceae bacterium]|nr:hypothetical protein [Micromonosporaceae bacterium]